MARGGNINRYIDNLVQTRHGEKELYVKVREKKIVGISLTTLCQILMIRLDGRMFVVDLYMSA